LAFNRLSNSSVIFLRDFSWRGVLKDVSKQRGDEPQQTKLAALLAAPTKLNV
jgi:hypothetical protein